jgi:predicted aspartyl protease
MKKLILLLFIPLISFGQNQNDCITKEIVEENYTYNGCVNYEGTPNGKGKFSQSNGLKYDGMFKDFKFHGYGVLTFSNGDVYKGNFVEDKKQGQGELTYANRGAKYVGSFNNDMYSGQGIQTLYFDEQTQVRDGFFNDNTFQHGTETINFNRSGIIDTYEYKDFDIIKAVRKENQALVSEQIGEFFSNGRLKNGSEINYDGNLQTYLEYKNGEEVSRSTNIDNRYNEQEIIGSDDSIELDLEVEGNTKYINVNFESENEPYRFVFDTGAESFVIGYLLFEELKSKGLAFEDMGIKKTTRGVSGIPFESKVIKIRAISIGSYTVKNVYTSVPLIETANSNLLGISFMKKFRDVKWSLNGDKLIFEK